MGRHQFRLLVCSIAALALLIVALFGKSWFTASMGFGPTIELDLRTTKLCQDGICTIIPLGKLRGIYPVTGAIAFWSALPVVLLVLVQCGIRLLGGTANESLTRIGYLLAFLALASGFAAGFLFGPETQGMGPMAGIVVERTIAPGLFAIGALLSMLALRFATIEPSTTDAATYKPVVVRKDLQSDRLPVTPITGVKKLPTQPLPAGPSRPKVPDSLPFDSSYTAAPDLDPGPAERARSSTSQPLDPARPKTPTGQPLEISIRATTPAQPTGVEASRPKSPTGSPERAKSTTTPPIEPIEIVHRPEARPRSPSSAPLSEADLVDVNQRARTIDLQPQRARTSSSGPVDVAARLNAAAAEAAAHISVKPPLPVPEPTPPDEIAVAPESGLRIRKRTPTGGSQPLTREEPSPSIAPPEVGLHFRKKAPSVAPPPENSLPESAFAPPPAAESARKKSVSMAGVPMPSIRAEGLADVLAAQPSSTSTSEPGARQTLAPPVGASPTIPPALASAETVSPGLGAAKSPTIPPAIGTAETSSPAFAAAKSPTIPPAITAAKSPTIPPEITAAKSPTIPAAKSPTIPPAIGTAETSSPALAAAKSPTTPPAVGAADTISPAAVAARSPTIPPAITAATSPTSPPVIAAAKSPTTPPAVGAADTISPALATAKSPTTPPALGTAETISPALGAAKSPTIPPAIGAADTISPALANAKTQTLPPPIAASAIATAKPPTNPPPLATAGPAIGSEVPAAMRTQTTPITRTASFPPPPISRTTTPQNTPAIARTTTPGQPSITAAKTQTLPPSTLAGARSQTAPAGEKQKTLPPPMTNVLPAPASASGSGSLPALSRTTTPTSQGSGGMAPSSDGSGSLPGSIADAARAHADSQPPANMAQNPRPATAGISPRPSGTYSQQFPRPRPPDAKTDEWRPLPKSAEDRVATPEHLRGQISYAVLTAQLSGAGIKVQREDGMTKLVEWGEIVGIVARRLPPGSPYDGATFVDLVSTTGSTLRILPWTRLEGHPFAQAIVARAREVVNIVAAQSLDARLDAATKLFADSEGQASQLPDAAALAAHDQKLA